MLQIILLMPDHRRIVRVILLIYLQTLALARYLRSVIQSAYNLLRLQTLIEQ